METTSIFGEVDSLDVCTLTRSASHHLKWLIWRLLLLSVIYTTSRPEPQIQTGNAIQKLIALAKQTKRYQKRDYWRLLQYPGSGPHCSARISSFAMVWFELRRRRCRSASATLPYPAWMFTSTTSWSTRATPCFVQPTNRKHRFVHRYKGAVTKCWPPLISGILAAVSSLLWSRCVKNLKCMIFLRLGRTVP